MQKRSIGITGQSGFIGTHLANHLAYATSGIDLVPFEDVFFSDAERLAEFAGRCDAIVHLAAVNRSSDPAAPYEINVDLVRRLVLALAAGEKAIKVIFASSSQEALDNPYGRSKSAGRRILEEWAARTPRSQLVSLVIPNVFGPFGHPFYNSVVATFCHQLTRDMEPKLEIDAPLPLIYINDLVRVFASHLAYDTADSVVSVEPIAIRRVSELLAQLSMFRKTYLQEHTIPPLENYFDVCLFNTFRSYVEYDYFPIPLQIHSDNRGHLSEVIRSSTGGQVFYSITKPGIVRGNHFHSHKIERFCVINGEAIIRLRNVSSSRIIEYRLSGDRPAYVDIPIFHTHNIENVGRDDLLTLFWTNEAYDPQDPDTFHVVV